MLRTPDNRKGVNTVMLDTDLRKKVKLVVAMNDDISYQDISDLIDIKLSSLYCWLNKQYELNYKKAMYLDSWCNDMIADII